MEIVGVELREMVRPSSFFPNQTAEQFTSRLTKELYSDFSRHSMGYAQRTSVRYCRLMPAMASLLYISFRTWVFFHLVDIVLVREENALFPVELRACIPLVFLLLICLAIHFPVVCSSESHVLPKLTVRYFRDEVLLAQHCTLR